MAVKVTRVVNPNAALYAELRTRPTIRVLSFDPGITEMGWAVIDYCPKDDTYTVIKTGVIVGRKLANYSKELKLQFTKAFCILDAYYHLVTALLLKYKPDFVSSEGAFQARFPQAFASLTLVIHTIRRAVCEVFGRDIFTVAPMETKKEIANNHMADKALIKKGVLGNEKIIIADNECDKENLTEHQYDAIGHGYCFIRRILHVLLEE